MKFNLWFVVFIALMPLFILISGLGAAADALGSPVVWGALVAVLVADLGAAWLATRQAAAAAAAVE